MARVTTCDGTGVPIPDDTPTTGLFGHQYSDEARPLAEAYLQAVNDLHTELATMFQFRLATLRETYHRSLRELPDEP